METFDFNTVAQQVEDVIRYSQDFEDKNMNVHPLLEKWKQNKQFFINQMNGKLIYEYPEQVSFHLSKEARKDKCASFIYDVEMKYDNSAIAAFLKQISDEEFFSNKTEQRYKVGDIIIPSGMKVVKAFKLFERNDKLLEDIQNAASRIIQEDIVSGKLCISVHPLDYLSVSENIHNWRSCHALDGDYRSGNLNYMVDNCTVVCYLRSDEEVILPHFPNTVPWNSKKWRVLIYFSQDHNMVFLGRQYPFSSEIGVTYIQKTMLPRITSCPYWTEFQPNSHEDTVITTQPYDFIIRNGIRIGNSFIGRREWIQDGYNTHHFNDVTLSSFYTEPLYSYAYGVNNTAPSTTTFKIGEAAPCPVCGSREVMFDDGMFCDDCRPAYSEEESYDDEYYECSNCNDTYRIDDMIWLPLSGSYICPYCFDNQEVVTRCENCGIKDYPEYIQFNREKNQYLCRDCANNNQRPTIESIWF